MFEAISPSGKRYEVGPESVGSLRALGWEVIDLSPAEPEKTKASPKATSTAKKSK